MQSSSELAIRVQTTTALTIPVMLSFLFFRSLASLMWSRSYLHVQHTELIQEFEKSLENDAEFPCCTCEQLLLGSYT